MIEARGLVKTYGDKVAVNGLTFDVQPGLVTGFLGPNGAGKSTTLRMVLGLDTPTQGTVTVNGRPYNQHRRPLHQVGALLEARAIHPGRSAYNHLLCLAQSNGLPRKRVDVVLEQVGLSEAARTRVGAFSLGMGQRLGIAAALLGDPEVLLFDEPVNGLDPEGILWIRTMMRSLAEQGRTVFVSSHLMSEMALTADRLIVIGRGELIADTTVRDFIDRSSQNHVRVLSPQAAALSALLVANGAVATLEADGSLEVTGMSCKAVGEIAAANQIVLHELSEQDASLEEAFMELTKDSVQFHTGGDQQVPSPVSPSSKGVSA
ncbi:MAG TPA: ATP-binding cassette domain-containing protein [Mycobacteriales bacterium]|nr:ATP-binding cassette domain-containing protein [Mycobacteriales bacterium]